MHFAYLQWDYEQGRAAVNFVRHVKFMFRSLEFQESDAGDFPGKCDRGMGELRLSRKRFPGLAGIGDFLRGIACLEPGGDGPVASG